MIALPRQHAESQSAKWHAGFVELLPRIERYARAAFRRRVGESKEDAVHEVVANCLKAYRRLHDRNELHRAFASALVRYGVAQYYHGRRVGTAQCSRDVYSVRARHEAGVEIHSLGSLGEQHDEWLECLTDNGRTPVPEQAHFRIEFPRWLSTQTNRNRQIAEALALGYSTSEVADKFNLSPGRVSQIRGEFYDSWREFSGEMRGLASRECDGDRRIESCRSLLSGRHG